MRIGTCMTEEYSEKFTNELGNLNTNLELLNQKFDMALEISEKDIALRFAEHERDCPARKSIDKNANSDEAARKAVKFWSSMVPVFLRIILPLLGVGGLTYTAINQNNNQPAAITAPDETVE